MPNEAQLPTIPVTIVTGFLGSGKTTFLNQLLTESHGKKLAIVLNEIGEVNLDSELVIKSLDENLKILNNGCICCTVREDLSSIAKDLIAKGIKMDGLVIETTGMADPSPIAQTFFMDEELVRSFHLDAIVTIVDTLNIDRNLKETEETQSQIGFADVVILNKTDLISESTLNSVQSRLKEINSLAKYIPTKYSKVPVAEVFGIKAFDLQARSAENPDFLKAYHKHRHDDSIQSIYIEELRPLNLEKLNRFFSLVLQELGEQILRFKGVACVTGEPNRIIFQGVHMNMSSHLDRLWEPGETVKTQMVFIGRHLPSDVLQEGLKMCTSET